MADAPALGAIPALLYAWRSDCDATDAELYAPRPHEILEGEFLIPQPAIAPHRRDGRRDAATCAASSTR